VNDILKQRLVGALILVALGVVFWPIIFVEPGERAAPAQERIPLPPAIDTSPIAAPDQDGLRGSPDWELQHSDEPAVLMPDAGGEIGGPGAAAVPAEAAPEASAPVTPAVAEVPSREVAPERPALDAQGVPVAWILQVASVSSAAKADQLRDKLLAMDEKAYVKKIERGDKDLYRVYVGPNFERAQLEKIQGTIDSRFGVRSMIVRYAP
jgi:DedD protein